MMAWLRENWDYPIGALARTIDTIAAKQAEIDQRLAALEKKPDSWKEEIVR